MKTLTSTQVTTAKYWANLALQTRRFGHVYVPAAARQSITSWEGLFIDGVRYYYASYGRSLQSGGHKYKVYAVDPQSNKPISSKLLRDL